MPPKQASETVCSARQYLLTGENDRAFAQLKQALEIDPENQAAVELEHEVKRRENLIAEVRSLTERGESAMQTGDNKCALKYFNKALDLFENVDRDSSERHAVEHDLEQVNEVLALQSQGEAQVASDKLDDAIRSFAQALAIEPQNEELHTLLKKAQQLREKQNQAQTLVDEGVAFYEIKDFDASEDKMRQALEIWPHCSDAKTWLGKIEAARDKQALDDAAAKRANAAALAATQAALPESAGCRLAVGPQFHALGQPPARPQPRVLGRSARC